MLTELPNAIGGAVTLVLKARGLEVTTAPTPMPIAPRLAPAGARATMCVPSLVNVGCGALLKRSVVAPASNSPRTVTTVPGAPAGG